MSVAIITGAGGLIGAEAARFFSRKGLVVVGIDNDMRAAFFGSAASTRWSWERLQRDVPFYTHVEADIRDADAIENTFGRYFGMKTACFRGGCLTGPGHSGTQLHGFLSYLVKCAVTGEPYTVFGYKAKQVRDNIHSFDLVNAFWCVFENPRSGEVYNIGG